jgi:aryl-alcohol dehydrogenase-like predicted oxidoreductase
LLTWSEILNKFTSKVVIGTWSLSGDFGRVNKQTIYKCIETSLKNNFLEFDTAPTYGGGKMHNILAEIIKHEKFIKINTKCGYNENSIKTFNISDLKRSIDSSLNKFGKINILFLHNPRNEVKDWRAVIKVLNGYKKNNLISYIGISLARDFYFKEEVMNSFDFLQDEINLLRFNSVKFLKNFNPKLMARSPLASGCLSGKLNINSKFSKKDYRFKWLSNPQRLKNILFQINQIKKNVDYDVKKISKKFLVQNKFINKIIFGIKNVQHINELMNDMKYFRPLSKDKINKIYSLGEQNYKLSHNEVGY